MTYKTLTLAIIALFTLVITSNAIASISPDSGKTCSIIGMVTDVQSRKEAGRGLSEGKVFTYIDVTIALKSINDNMSCKGNADGYSTFQMHSSFLGVYAPSVPKKGTCLKGSAKIMADGNFMSGHWLTVQEKLPKEQC